MPVARQPLDFAHIVHHAGVPAQLARLVLHNVAGARELADLVHNAHHTWITFVVDCPKCVLEIQMALCWLDVLAVLGVGTEADDIIRSAAVAARRPMT